MALTSIPGVARFHPRTDWVEDCFPIRGAAMRIGEVYMGAVHYSSALNLPDGDPGERIEDIPPRLRASNRDYWLNRVNNAPTVVCGRSLPGYSLGYSFWVDWLGGVWEVRGFDYFPAATAGHNHYTVAVMLITDRHDPASEAAWASTRAIFREAQRRSGRPWVQRPWGHNEFYLNTGVGTPTACPGVPILGQLHAGKGDLDNGTPPPPPPGGDMLPIEPDRTYDTRSGSGFAGAGQRLKAGVARKIPVVYGSQAFVRLQVVNAAGPGHLQVSPSNTFRKDTPSVVNYMPDGRVYAGEVPVAAPDGHVWVKALTDCDLISDTFAIG